MADPYVVLHRTHDVNGNPSVGSQLLEVPFTGDATSEDVLAVIRPLAPRETERSGVYWFRDERGTGWFEVHQASSETLGELDDAVRVLEIEARLGQPEVYRQPELGVLALSRPRTTNPYFLMATGLGFAAMFVWTLVVVIRDIPELGFVIVIGTMAVGGIGAAAWVFSRGLIRVAWWHRARSEARQLGLPLPRSLRVWN